MNITNGTVLPTTNEQSLDQAIESLSNAVRNGDLSQIPLVVDDTQITLEILSVGQCMDIMCNLMESKELARAPEPSNQGSNTAYHKSQVFAIIALTTMVIIYVISLFNCIIYLPWPVTIIVLQSISVIGVKLMIIFV